MYDLGGKHTSTPRSDLSHMPLCSVRRPADASRLDMIQRGLPYKPQFDEQSRRIDEPAICLVCGTIVRAGNAAKTLRPLRHGQPLETAPASARHAHRRGGGHGMYDCAATRSSCSAAPCKYSASPGQEWRGRREEVQPTLQLSEALQEAGVQTRHRQRD